MSDDDEQQDNFTKVKKKYEEAGFTIEKGDDKDLKKIVETSASAMTTLSRWARFIGKLYLRLEIEVALADQKQPDRRYFSSFHMLLNRDESSTACEFNRKNVVPDYIHIKGFTSALSNPTGRALVTKYKQFDKLMEDDLTSDLNLVKFNTLKTYMSTYAKSILWYCKEVKGTYPQFAGEKEALKYENEMIDFFKRHLFDVAIKTLISYNPKKMCISELFQENRERLLSNEKKKVFGIVKNIVLCEENKTLPEGCQQREVRSVSKAIGGQGFDWVTFERQLLWETREDRTLTTKQLYITADLTSDDYLFKEFLPKMAAYSLLKPRAVNCDPSLVLFIATDKALQKVAKYKDSLARFYELSFAEFTQQKDNDAANVQWVPFENSTSVTPISSKNVMLAKLQKIGNVKFTSGGKKCGKSGVTTTAEAAKNNTFCEAPDTDDKTIQCGLYQKVVWFARDQAPPNSGQNNSIPTKPEEVQIKTGETLAASILRLNKLLHPDKYKEARKNQPTMEVRFTQDKNAKKQCIEVLTTGGFQNFCDVFKKEGETTTFDYFVEGIYFQDGDGETYFGNGGLGLRITQSTKVPDNEILRVKSLPGIIVGFRGGEKEVSRPQIHFESHDDYDEFRNLYERVDFDESNNRNREEDFAVFDGNGYIQNVSLSTELVQMQYIPQVTFNFDEELRIITFESEQDYNSYIRLHYLTPFSGDYRVEIGKEEQKDENMRFPRGITSRVARAQAVKKKKGPDAGARAVKKKKATVDGRQAVKKRKRTVDGAQADKKRKNKGVDGSTNPLVTPCNPSKATGCKATGIDGSPAPKINLNKKN